MDEIGNEKYVHRVNHVWGVGCHSVIVQQVGTDTDSGQWDCIHLQGVFITKV